MNHVDAIRALVMAIPSGCVMTYGEIGQSVGIGPRQAGRAVSLLDEDVPWWRIIYADGTPATCHGGNARALLESEGLPFIGDRIDLLKVRDARTSVHRD